MNQKATYPLPSRDGWVYFEGYDKPLPSQMASAITELGNPELRPGGAMKLFNAMKTYGLHLSNKELCDILVANNRVPIEEAKAIVAGLQFIK